MSRVVLDASAVLVLLNREPGQDRVAAELDDALIAAPNATEVLTRLIDVGMADRKPP